MRVPMTLSTTLYNSAIALDATNRSYDADGRLHIARSRISHASVNDYMGAEIPSGTQSHNLQSGTRYGVYRDRDELARAAPTFERVPIYGYSHTDKFDKLDRQRIIGTTGSNVTMDDDGFLVADITIWEKDAIGRIERGEIVELSCGYRYELDPTPGTLDNKPYVGIMRNIRGNHVALVKQGRAGHEVRVGDAANKLIGATSMLETQLQLLEAGAKLRSAIIAADATFTLDAMPDLDSAIKRIIALDGSMQEQAMKNLIDVAKSPDAKSMTAGDMDDENDETEAMDALVKRAARVAKKLEKRKEKDKGKGIEMKTGDEQQVALDAMVASIRAEAQATHKASILTRSVLGDIALDSAEAYYRKALDELKVGHSSIKELAGLETLFGLALSQRNVAKAQAVSGKPVTNDSARKAVDVKIDLSHIRHV